MKFTFTTGRVVVRGIRVADTDPGRSAAAAIGNARKTLEFLQRQIAAVEYDLDRWGDELSEADEPRWAQFYDPIKKQDARIRASIDALAGTRN